MQGGRLLRCSIGWFLRLLELKLFAPVETGQKSSPVQLHLWCARSDAVAAAVWFKYGEVLFKKMFHTKSVCDAMHALLS